MLLKQIFENANVATRTALRWRKNPSVMQMKDVRHVAKLNGIRPVDLAAQIFALPDEPEAEQLELFNPEGGEV
jgi:hypothetical protein